MSKIHDPTTNKKGEKKKCILASTAKHFDQTFLKFVEGIPRDSKVAIEACSYWYPVCDFLEERGIEMVLSHPSKTRIIADGKIKTDKIDSKWKGSIHRGVF